MEKLFFSLCQVCVQGQMFLLTTDRCCFCTAFILLNIEVGFFFLLHFHSLSEAWNLSFTNTYLWMRYTHNNLRHSWYWHYFFKFTQIMITQAFWALQLSFHLSLTHKNLLRLLDKGLCWDPSLEPWGISGMTPQRWTSAAPRWSPVSSCCTAPRSPSCK